MSNTQHSTRALNNLAREFAKCEACPRHKRRRCTIEGRGNPQAKIVFVQERYYEADIYESAPLSGMPGNFLSDVLMSLDYDPDDVWVTGALKCPDREFKAPKDDIVKACRHWVEKELSIIQPDVIVCLGTAAVKAVLPKQRPEVAYNDGLVFDALIPGVLVPYSVPVVVTHNPMLLLRNQDYSAEGGMSRFYRHVQTAVEMQKDIEAIRAGKSFEEVFHEQSNSSN